MGHAGTQRPSRLGAGEDAYLDQLTGRLLEVLGEDLVAVYLTGSAGLGEWVRGRSDLDVMAISEKPLPAGAKREVVRRLSHRALPCPARCLELVVYGMDAIRAPGPELPFEVNLNTGDGMADHASFIPAEEPAHWFLIDAAITRTHGQALMGPPPEQVIGAVPHGHLLAALQESLNWHAQQAPASADTVLNACRAWAYGSEQLWLPKSAAGRWALARNGDRAVVRGALEWRDGSPIELDRTEVDALLEVVMDSLRASSPDR